MYIPGVGGLIGKLGEVLANEASLIWGAPDGVKDLMEELENMQLFLIDADQGEMEAQSSGGVEMKWVADIRDKAYEAEDIIDEFTYHMDKHHHDDISSLSRFLHLLVDAPTTLWVMHQTAHKLQMIKKSITDIAERRTKYKAGVSAHDAAGKTYTTYLQQQQAVRILRDKSYFTEEKSIIGFREETDSLKQLLLPDAEPLRAVIWVFGMGGSGKTTLVSKIYNNQRGLGGFVLSAWITVSRTYTVIELLRNLIRKLYEVKKKETPKDLDKKEYIDLVELVKGCLKGKRYLIVFDDVWDTIFWEQMKVALPEDEIGSRILVTTRDESIAPSPSNVKSYKLPVGQLQGSEPWDLFSMKAFADCPNKTCPQKLDLLARLLVDKCRGLPLALVTLGGHMSSRREEHEWTDVRDNLFKTSDMDDAKRILRLSYSDLPYSLKHCFLYCCLFPEDYPIKRTRLIRRWIAEGFMEGGDEITPEEEAESYLSELVFRSMLLVETRNVTGRPKVIKMHDVMRDFALEIAKKEKFCGVYDVREAINEFEAYRWSIQFHPNGDEELKLPGNDMTRVRSLSLLGNPTSFSRKHLLKFKMLRMLDLENYYAVSKLPHEVGNLFNLRYLNLRASGIQKLPSSIGRLLNLQTLDISRTSIIELPEGVSKLRKLRHLIMNNIRSYENGNRILFDISKLTKLQVLIGVCIDKGETLRQLGTLTKLTRLDILHVHHDGGDLEERRKNWEALGQLKLLQRLKLMWRIGRRDIENLIILPLNLKKIHLDVSVRFQSRWFDSLHNIQCMSLSGCTVSGDQLPRIAALENLVSLELSYWDHEEVLHFCGGFPKLKQLSLSFFRKVKKVIFEKGAMPHMESLSILNCNYLQQSLPEGIEHLTNLQKLEVPFRLKDSYEEGIKNWKSKVQHIPTINIKYTHDAILDLLDFHSVMDAAHGQGGLSPPPPQWRKKNYYAKPSPNP